MKRKLEIYKKYHQGIKTGILIKTYNISRQRIHQILKEVELYQLKNAETISQKKEEIQKIKNEKLCGSCYFYDTNGFCNHFDSLDECAAMTLQSYKSCFPEYKHEIKHIK